MQPDMLVSRTRLTFVIVALSIEALLTIVTSARFQAGGATGSSEGLDSHATKSSRRNFNQSLNNQDGSSAMAKDSVSSSGNSRSRNNSFEFFNASQSWTERSINSSSSRRKIADKDDHQDKTSTPFLSEDIQVGCKELRARSFISDGFCTSEKPILEIVCAGHCLPIMDLPWYAAFVKTLAKSKLKDYQCVEDVVRRKRVKLLCQNGAPRHYKIKVVKSCKCKKITNKHNKTPQKKKRRRKEPKTKSTIGS